MNKHTPMQEMEKLPDFLTAAILNKFAQMGGLDHVMQSANYASRVRSAIWLAIFDALKNPALNTSPSVDGLREAATELSNFAWSSVSTDCTEAVEYLQSLLGNLREALASTKIGEEKGV